MALAKLKDYHNNYKTNHTRALHPGINLSAKQCHRSASQNTAVKRT